MLKMVLETYQQKICDDIALIPVSLCYDEVPEQGSYTKELGGGQKIKESAKELIRSRKIIKNNIGKVYVRFAPALFAKDILKTADENGLDDTLTLQKTAFQLCKSINDVTPITPKSLVCSILLAHRLSALSLEEILRLSIMLAEYVQWSGLTLSADLNDGFKRAIEQTVRRLQKTGVASVSDSVPRAYFCENRKRILLSFYKNNAIHCLVVPSIAMLSFFDALASGTENDGGGAFLERIQQTALTLRNILKFEFFFNPSPQFIGEIRANLSHFLGGDDWQEKTPDANITALNSYFSDWNDISIFLRLLGELLESYLTVFEFVRDSTERGGEKKSIVQRILKYAEARSAQGAISFPESISIQNYSNALQLLENLRFLSLEKEADRVSVQLQTWDEKMANFANRIRGFLDLIMESPEALIYHLNPKLIE